MLDGRRIWLVSGSVQYARVPREQWADRIHAAKLAGLNTIETPVFWGRHEPVANQFDFTGDNDLRHFVKLIGAAGLFCILRPGPYIGSGWDFGGLPPWLLQLPDVKLRTVSGPFLEACSRYLTAVADQVRDLQVTSPGKGGPILLVQNESSWICGHDDLARGYLGELNRYLREGGLTVPTINANNLWQGVESEIDSWTGGEHLLPIVRQLATVRADQPRLVIEMNMGARTTWGRPTEVQVDPAAAQRRLAEVLAAGGQFNLHPFHGGTNFGFTGGRTADARDAFVTTSNDQQAPLAEAGHPGRSFAPVRRICTFASRFARVFANLDPAYQPITLDPTEPGSGAGAGATPSAASHPRGAKKSGAPACDSCAVIHTVGSQGGVAFVFGADPAVTGVPPAGLSARLLLPDGVTLPVELGSQAVAWCLFRANLNGRAHLDYCNLNAFAVVGRAFVCFGPVGARGLISINGSPVEVAVPKGNRPLVLEHESAVLVVCNEETIDATYATDEAIYVGVAGLTGEGTPLALPDSKSYLRINTEGEAANQNVGGRSGIPAVKALRAGLTKVPLGAWMASPMTDYIAGSSARFASIPGPADLTRLGSPFGYGWYRLAFKSSATRKIRLDLPRAGDRLHAFLDGEPLGVVGLAPGAAHDLALPLKKGDHTLVFLAENLGRYAAGSNLGELKGLYGHLWETSPIKTPKPGVERGDPVDVLAFRAPLWEVHRGDFTLAERLTWHVIHRKKTPLIVHIDAFAGRGLVLLNNKPIHYLDRGGWDRLIIEPEQLTRGGNLVQIALLGDHAHPEGEEAFIDAALHTMAHAVSFFEGVAPFSAKADWAFAKWEAPPPASYKPAGRSDAAPGPTWWKTHFDAGAPDPSPFVLDLAGMTKGQCYVNGRHVGRYFVATPDGEPLPPQTQYLIPRPWVKSGKDNELVLFDEHRGNPSQVRLSHDHSAVPIVS